MTVLNNAPQASPHQLQRHPAAWQERSFYKFWAGEHVRFADLDALGHVNNNSYGLYVETARIALWQHILQDNFWKQTHYNLLRAAHTEYHRELHYPNQLELGVRILRLGNSSSEAVVGVFTASGCHATTHSVGVYVNATTHAVETLPESLRQKFAVFM